MTSFPLSLSGSSRASGEASPRTPRSPRLTKLALSADSKDSERSKQAGYVTMEDGSGTPRSVRVVQSQEEEDLNMIRVSWVWTLDNMTYQIELRHGRKSGIRKVYVNKKLEERMKSVKNLLMDQGSTHEFVVGEHQAQIMIAPKGGSGFKYQLTINGQEIEQALTSGQPTDLGMRQVELQRRNGPLGMSVKQNPNGPGVLIAEVEETGAAYKTGLLLGDVIMCIDESETDDPEQLVQAIGTKVSVMCMVVGASPSQVVRVSKLSAPLGLEITTTRCGVGVLIAGVMDGGEAAKSNLKAGQVILAVNEQLAESTEVVQKAIKASNSWVDFTVVGH